MKAALALLLATLLASPLGAHPHIFVDTGLDLRFDAEGRLTEVRVVWIYDELYSLLITEDRGLDPEFDGILTPEEVADLQGFDMNWTPGFNGDLVILQNGAELRLSGPLEPTASFENGRITTTHVRRVDAAPAGDAPLAVKPYDATYYTAYDITQGVRIEGTESCRSRIEVPDVNAALRELQDVLAALDEYASPEDENLPDVGGLLASTVHVTCDIS